MAARRIVVATQDSALIGILEEIACDEGFDHVVVESGADMLYELLENDYEVGILDLDLPCCKSVSLVAVMRRIRPKVPLLVLSSDPSVELGRRIVQEGVAYYDLKPVAKERWRSIMTAWLH